MTQPHASSFRPRTILIATGMLAGTAMLPALAQTPDAAISPETAAATQQPETTGAAPVGEEGGLQDILVTARKRSVAESVQDVPIAISAFSGEQIDATFAVTLTDIGLITPNSNFAAVGTLPNVANFAIRGMGTVGQSIPSADPAVGVVQDGVAFGTIFGVVTDLFDVASIEILRGPQGTLFGRNVTGGAVVIRSNRPTNDFRGKAQATVGSYDRYEGNLLVSGPLSDQWSAKLAASYGHQGGIYKNLTLGGRQGQSETFLVRPAIRFDSGEFEATLIGEYGRTTGDGPSTRNTFFRGVAIDPYAAHTTTQSTRGENELTWRALTFEANLEVGPGVLTGVFGYRDIDQSTIADIDGAPFAVRFEFGEGTGLVQDQQSLELRWAGDLFDGLSVTSGINLFTQKYTYTERRLLVDLLDQPARSTIEHETAGLFIQGDYTIVPGVVATLGGRYSWEEKRAGIGVVGDPNGVGSCAVGRAPFTRTVDFADCRQVFRDSKSWKNFTPKVGLNWTIVDDVLVYGSFTRGFRSGGYNVRFSDTTLITRPANPASTPGPYDEEVVDAYEIGAKTTFFDRRARVNVALFQNEYSDLQRTALNANSGQQTLNAAAATVKGFEVDVTLALTDRLTLTGAYGYTDAQYDSFDFITNATGLDVEDIRFVLTPEHTASGSATYRLPIGDVGRLDARVAYSYVDDVVADDFQRVQIRSYGLVDASLSFVMPERGLKVSAFGRNLTDEVYFNFAFDNSASAIGTRTALLTPSRTFGIEVGYEF